MANWHKVLDVKDIWDKTDNMEYDEKSGYLADEGGPLVTARLRKLYKVENNHQLPYPLNEITESFEFCCDIEDFDNALHDLYDWGDEGHRLWIKTF